MVQCVKFGRELPGLEEPPVAGALGERIFANVSAQAWELWKEQRVILINHYGLSLYDPNHQAFLREQLEAFFFGEGAQLPEDWTPPTAAGGKGAKGAPAPRRK
jgi:Fe-S cluster biosynthesis and repair protein YggX